MNNIPPHLSEKIFRRFEGVIAEAVIMHGRGIIHVNPSKHGYSPNTFAARFRDAKASLARFHWPSAVIDWAKFKAVEEDIVASQDPETGSIRIGSRSLLKANNITVEPIVVSKMETDGEPITIHSDDEKALLCLLASKRLLARPVLVTGLTDEDSIWLQDNFDVTISRQSNTTHVVQ